MKLCFRPPTAMADQWNSAHLDWNLVYQDSELPLRAYARYLLRDADDAQDLVHDVFVVAISTQDRIQPDRPVLPWLKGITLNLARKRWRGAARFTCFSEVERGGALDELADPFELERLVLDFVMIAERLSQLSPSLKGSIYGAALGFTSLEVAEIVGTSKAAAERRLSRARARLRHDRPGDED